MNKRSLEKMPKNHPHTFDKKWQNWFDTGQEMAIRPFSIMEQIEKICRNGFDLGCTNICGCLIRHLSLQYVII